MNAPFGQNERLGRLTRGGSSNARVELCLDSCKHLNGLFQHHIDATVARNDLAVETSRSEAVAGKLDLSAGDLGAEQRAKDLAAMTGSTCSCGTDGDLAPRASGKIAPRAAKIRSVASSQSLVWRAGAVDIAPILSVEATSFYAYDLTGIRAMVPAASDAGWSFVRHSPLLKAGL